MDDNSILTTTKYKGYRLADVPESFLRFQYESKSSKIKGELRKYIERKFYNSIP
ncbi:hypothetical protein [Dyadobacter sp. CY312]|uniref:hypothetical protein n=1 Tax=Dyadobacter sp. CY312 TaxID=2907303 RepID=UPI001F254193|nr:hypothetical protein [Dyadobacter sp. CY312]MCE7039279.1 hypothetical protein [Dyadobacter sp. CY312]